MSISRRRFVNIGIAAASAGAAKLEASPMNQPIGFQNFEIFPDVAKDWQGTWDTMAGIGYKFCDLVKGGPVAQRTAAEIKASLTQAGLTADTCHMGYQLMTDKYGETIQYAHDLGLKYLVCQPAPRLTRRSGNVVKADDWKWMGEELNQIGTRTKRDGITTAYHNHEIEFVKVEDQYPYDILMANTDPALVGFQIDVGNLTFGGADAISFLKKYPTRYVAMHVKDFKPGKASVPVGSGDLDWDTIFALAKKANMKTYIAEVGAYGAATLSGAPLEPSDVSIIESFRRSFVFLNQFRNK
jgi:sugar phosphate isomerase/epimerase